MGKEDRRMNNLRVVMIVGLLAALVGFGIMALVMRDRDGQPPPTQQQQAATTAEGTTAERPAAGAEGTVRRAETPTAQPAPRPTADEPVTFFEEMLGAEDTRAPAADTGLRP